jgi:hypothetical protein
MRKSKISLAAGDRSLIEVGRGPGPFVVDDVVDVGERVADTVRVQLIVDEDSVDEEGLAVVDSYAEEVDSSAVDMVDTDVVDSGRVKEVDSGNADVVDSGDIDVFESDDKDDCGTVNDPDINREVGVVGFELVDSETLEVEAPDAEVGIDVANSEFTIDDDSEALDSEGLVPVFVSVEVAGSEVAAWLDNAVSEAGCVSIVLGSAWVDPSEAVLLIVGFTRVAAFQSILTLSRSPRPIAPDMNI